jgi:site-specific recombinase XerD
MTITVYEDRTQRALDYLQNNVSALTFKIYEPAINRFHYWAAAHAQANTIPAETIAAYKAALVDEGLDRKTVNKHLSAIRAYFKAQAALGNITQETLQNINAVPNLKVQGRRYGVRLTIEQAHIIINAPDIETEIGRRDKAVLAILIGCGLRRSEIVDLTWGQIYFNGVVWVIRNLLGKHGRTRTVSIAPWVKRILDSYSEGGKSTERIFTSQQRKKMTAQTIYNIVKRYDDAVGMELAPHDLRRTYASIARKNAGVEGLTQLSKQLGHSSVAITEHYIGEDDDLEYAATFIPDLDI